MKINGLKHLNSNWYKSIMIRNIDEENVQVNVKNDKIAIPLLNSSNSFNSNFKKLSTEEQIEKIIEYYLKYNKICGLHYKDLPRYEDKFNIIEGSRDLFIQVRKDLIKPEVNDAIIKKYFHDRDEFVYRDCENMQYFCFGTDIWPSYKITKDFFSKHNVIYLSMYLKEHNGKLIDCEENFIINFIKYKLDKVNEKIHFGYSYRGYHKDLDEYNFMDDAGYYIYCDDFVIRLSDKLYYKVYDLLLKHNNRIDNVRKLQLTLGYDD